MPEEQNPSNQLSEPGRIWVKAKRIANKLEKSLLDPEVIQNLSLGEKGKFMKKALKAAEKIK